MKLYGYWRSSAAYRVRIALNIKGIDCEYESVHLVKDGGQQFSDGYSVLNPAQLVPTLVDGDLVLNQSMAILDYLENKYPTPALLPSDPAQRAQVLALANDIACDIHPLNNLRVLKYITGELGASEEQKIQWIHNWVNKGFSALEKQAITSGSTGQFLFGQQLTMADVVLIPQIYNALRFGVEMEQYPTLKSIWEHCNTLEGFEKALPENQADAG